MARILDPNKFQSRNRESSNFNVRGSRLAQQRAQVSIS